MIDSEIKVADVGLRMSRTISLIIVAHKIHYSVDNFAPTAITSLDNLWEGFVDAFVVGK